MCWLLASMKIVFEFIFLTLWLVLDDVFPSAVVKCASKSRADNLNEFFFDCTLNKDAKRCSFEKMASG
jgi:hypothetical protein